ncbi:hypothetical protein IEO21_07711 [Rhodonia placenta]|uniref:Protein kinase domain-containing protein n=1 Tax=Rhodonia placenta TaxID=104341 RepID=A0A8H7TZX6_9APHY|nr:hypothetical protein IEO21_07711 [Postia placenta]
MSTQIQTLRFQDLVDRDQYHVFNRIHIKQDIIVDDTPITIRPVLPQAGSHYILQHDDDPVDSPESPLPYPGRRNWPSHLKFAYPGILTSQLSSQGPHEPQDAICKVVSMSLHAENRLAHELLFYEKLEDLQGHVIPRCFGLFEGEIDRERVQCLVLEYCGEPVVDFRTTSWQFREKLVDIVHELHTRGIHHGGLHKENILCCYRLGPEARADGKYTIDPVLINFGNAFLKYKCDAMRNNEKIQLCVEEPEVMIGCQHLLRFARTISAWCPCETASSDILHAVTDYATL